MNLYKKEITLKKKIMSIKKMRDLLPYVDKRKTKGFYFPINLFLFYFLISLRGRLLYKNEIF